jgi:hypothetical protein
MKNTHTAPLEVLSARTDGTFATEPHEAGWADEAIAMLYVREVAGPQPQLVLSAQISVDGVRWFKHAADPLMAYAPGGYALPLTQFGNWLRLAGEITGGPTDEGTTMVIDLYWVLKG